MMTAPAHRQHEQANRTPEPGFVVLAVIVLIGVAELDPTCNSPQSIPRTGSTFTINLLGSVALNSSTPATLPFPNLASHTVVKLRKTLVFSVKHLSRTPEYDAQNRLLGSVCGSVGNPTYMGN